MHNRATEFATMLLAAQAGDVDAQYAIANKYWEGIGTRQDRVLGYAWTLMAAKNKNDFAQQTLAIGKMTNYMTAEQVQSARQKFTELAK